jgi:hypothetical protein
VFFVQLSVTNFDPHKGQRKGEEEEEEEEVVVVVVAADARARLAVVVPLFPLLLREARDAFREGKTAASHSSGIVMSF